MNSKNSIHSMIYKAVFHVDLKDEAILNLALNNIVNTLAALESKDKSLILLANGPAVTLFAGEAALPFVERIRELQEAGVRFQICNNAMNKFQVAKDDLAPGLEIIPAGIVGLIELQYDDYAYIKP